MGIGAWLANLAPDLDNVVGSAVSNGLTKDQKTGKVKADKGYKLQVQKTRSKADTANVIAGDIIKAPFNFAKDITKTIGTGVLFSIPGVALSVGTINSLRRYSKSVKERATKVHYSALQTPKKAKKDRTTKPTQQDGKSPADKPQRTPKPKPQTEPTAAEKAQAVIADQKIKLADMEEKLAASKQRLLNARKRTPEHLKKLQDAINRQDAKISVQRAKVAKAEEKYNKEK